MSAELTATLTAEYVQEATPKALLEDIRRRTESLQLSSLIHPHGFLVVLLQRTDREEWRFHVWPRGMRSTSGLPGPIHTHDEVLDSRILKGELTNVIYAVSEVQTAGLPIYEVEYPNDKYDPKAANLLKRSSIRADALAISNQLLGAGEVYSVPAHIFHQSIVPVSVCACTIVRMHSLTPGPVKVIGIDGYPEIIRLQRAECSVAATLAAAQM